jgi:hypothetical protein
MTVIDGRIVMFADWVDESTLGTTPTNPTMNAFPGELVGIEITSGPEIDSYPVLQGASVTDPLCSGKTVKTGETHKVKITIRANGLTWLPYALMAATTSTYATGKVSHPISIGIKAGSEYCVLSGCVLMSAEFNIPDMKTANTLTLTYMCIDKSDWSSTDYIGTGSHGTPSSDDPYTMSDLSSVTYDSSAPSASNILLESLKFTISYDMEGVTDLSATAPSKIGDYAFMSRSMQLDMGMTMMAMSAHDDLLSASDHTFEFTLDSKAFTFSAIKWTNNPAVNMAAASKVGMTLTSDGEATRLAIA